ncbi:hypothetical protein ABW19_dt0204022 [Dactylella cylindrospora]|nr:hypothetical protein ABW19_dt0204022 [Dactylella cylindrospora]
MSPNGYRAAVLLEELKLAYPDFTYKVHRVDIFKGETKSDWYLKVNPNGKIPALVDGDAVIWESGAILLHLVTHHDPLNHFTFPQTSPEYPSLLSYVFLAATHLGPTSSEVNYHISRSPVKSSHSISRYATELDRLYDLYENTLSSAANTTGGNGTEEGETYLVGGKYTIADIATFPQIRSAETFNMEISKYPHLDRWCQRILQREGVKNGLEVPENQLGITREQWVQNFRERRDRILAMGEGDVGA